jgi:hypothetical protein
MTAHGSDIRAKRFSLVCAMPQFIFRLTRMWWQRNSDSASATYVGRLQIDGGHNTASRRCNDGRVASSGAANEPVPDLHKNIH